MTTVPRLLVVMGSGETSPTMSKTHRELFARLGPPPVPAVVLDTPFGFQENADDIAARAVAYFRESVQRPVQVASLRRAGEGPSLSFETAVTRLAEARWVFAGPGSPSYAVRQWRRTPVPGLLADKLAHGGCVVFASAAAATLGRLSVPVYEIYKVGEDPHWIEGLDLLRGLGLPAIVIPHFNNAEGGNHDTRYCYLGERRLARLEAELAPDEFVLGLDEHTAAVVDLDAGTVDVAGRGALTVRVAGRSTRIAAGRSVALTDLRHLALETGGATGRPGAGAAGRRDAGATGPPGAGTGTVAQPEPPPPRSPLLDDVARLQRAFAAALDARDAAAAAAAALELDDLVVAWSRDTLESDELDRARAALRSMIVRLGEAAAAGVRDPREVVGPFVAALLEARDRARSERRFADADRLRDHLAAAGIEVHDTRAGTEWQLR